jgi:hypothetical protein
MYGYNNYEVVSRTVNTVDGVLIWSIISLVIAIIGGITLYFIYLRSNKKFNNFLDKLRDFLNFKSLLLEEILKVTYLVLAIYITLYSFGLIAVSFASFLLTLLLGNLVLRIIYELSILLVKICKNTSDINSKLK